MLPLCVIITFEREVIIMELTKDADKLLCQIYAEYLKRRKNGVRKSQAIHFEAPPLLVEEFLCGEHPDDVSDLIFDLAKINFVEAYLDASFYLTDNAIIYMENRFKNGLIEVADFISKFIP